MMVLFSPFFSVCWLRLPSFPPVLHATPACPLECMSPFPANTLPTCILVCRSSTCLPLCLSPLSCKYLAHMHSRLSQFRLSFPPLVYVPVCRGCLYPCDVVAVIDVTTVAAQTELFSHCLSPWWYPPPFFLCVCVCVPDEPMCPVET